MKMSRQLVLLALLTYLILPIGMCVLSAAENGTSERAIATPASTPSAPEARSTSHSTASILLWTLGAAEVWLLGCLTVWSVVLRIRPLAIKSLDERLSRTQRGAFSWSHLCLLRPFAQRHRVLDAWIQQHAEVIRDWHGISHELESDEPATICCEQDVVPSQADAIASHFHSQQFCVVISGQNRRWDMQVLARLLQWSLANNPTLRLQPHQMIPVVLDRHCLDRELASRAVVREDGHKVETNASEEVAGDSDLLLRLVCTELRRLPDQGITWEIHWLRLLLSTGRMLIISEDWARLPELVQELIRKEFVHDRIQALAIVAGGADLGAWPNSIELSTALVADHAEIAPTGTVQAADAPTALAQPVSYQLEPVTAEADQSGDCSDWEAPPQIHPEGSANIDRQLLPFTRVAAEHQKPVPAPHAADQSDQLDRLPTAQAVEQLGAAVAAALPKWTAALEQGDVEARRRAAQDLSHWVLQVVPALTGSLHDSDVTVRRTAVLLLSQMQNAIQSSAVRAVLDTDTEACRLAALAISRIDEETVAPLALALADQLADVRSAAATAIGRLGPLAEPAVPRLCALLGDPQADCRRAAAVALGRIGQGARSAATVLSIHVTDESRGVRQAAIKALGQLGVVDASIINTLGLAVNDNDASVRLYACWALGEVGRSCPQAVEPLRTALNDSESEVRCQAVRSLGNLGPIAKAVASDLSQRLDDQDVLVRRAVVTAIGQVDLAAVPLLTHALEDPDAEVRRLAISTLSAIGLAAVATLVGRQEIVAA